MSGKLRLNKLLAAGLATGLVITGLHETAAMAFEPDAAAVDCDVRTRYDPQPPPYSPPDWGTALPTADLKAGAQVFAKCSSCHALDDTNGTGPGLDGAVGREPGTHAGFRYSQAMAEYREAHRQWTFDELDSFLRKPAGHLPGTKMTFVGIKMPQDRINLIAFLHNQGSVLAIPKPDPARQLAAASAASASEVRASEVVLTNCF